MLKENSYSNTSLLASGILKAAKKDNSKIHTVLISIQLVMYILQIQGMIVYKSFQKMASLLQNGAVRESKSDSSRDCMTLQ
jgi:hypothetical protein